MDEIYVPEKSTIVRVQGEVNFPKTVSYNSINSFNKYFRMAGGISEEGVSKYGFCCIS
jgi:hypothetical protein